MPTATLFDTEIISPSFTMNWMSFFTRPMGMTFLDDQKWGKQETDTNMVCGGFLESGKTHQVTGFACYPELGCPLEDLMQLATGVLEFSVGGTSDTKFKQPLMAFPNFAAKDSAGESYLNEYVASQRARCIFPFLRDGRPGYGIGVNQSFRVKITWPQKLRLSRAMRLMVVIDGLTSEASSGLERYSGIPNAYPSGITSWRNNPQPTGPAEPDRRPGEKEKLPEIKPERKKDKIVFPDID